MGRPNGTGDLTPRVKRDARAVHWEQGAATLNAQNGRQHLVNTLFRAGDQANLSFLVERPKRR